MHPLCAHCRNPRLADRDLFCSQRCELAHALLVAEPRTLRLAHDMRYADASWQSLNRIWEMPAYGEAA